MRRLLVAAGFLMLAVSVSAGGPFFGPPRLDLLVGESAEVSVEVTSWGTTIPRISFYSCDPSVATAEGKLEPREGAHYARGTIKVTALRPGTTGICAHRSSVTLVPITVTCGPVPPAEAANARMITRVGTPVTLSVIFPLLENTTYTWYRGRIGDTTTPLTGAQADLPFTPPAPGAHHVWVSVATPCSTSSVEFLVETPRRRAAGK